jgi:DNA-binding NarL/FixJ family response regulator
MPRSKLLLVDDSDQFRRLILRTLQQRAEFDLIQALDGWEAVQKAEEFQPDFILLDIGLPKLNGIEAGRRIQTLCLESKIVFLSQESSADVVAAALSLPSRGFIHKLRAQTYLLPTLEVVLEGKQFVGSGPEIGDGTKRQASHRHEVHFYPDDSVLLESLDCFIATALMANNAAIVLATRTHREILVQRLKDGGVDMDRAIQQGTYISLDAEDILSTTMVNCGPDCDLFLTGLRDLIDSAATATKLERPRVAIFGECVALLHAKGNLKAAISLEQSGNELLKAQATPCLDIMCAYPLLPFGKDPAFKSICAEHSAVSLR